MKSNRPRVLIVDDDRGWLELITGVLEDEGYVVASAVDGMAAVELMTSFAPLVVITDLEMPLMNGRELIFMMRSLARRLPVIVLTGERAIDGSKPVLEDAFRVLTKPVRIDDFLSAVAAASKDARAARAGSPGG